MAVNTIGATTQNDVMQLARQLAAALDTNRDGQITTNEFASFLSQLLTNTGSTSTGSSSGSSSVGASAAQSDQPLDVSQWVDPSTWNGNNAPYNVTLAGFSPQDHTFLTLGDLQQLKSTKYVVYDYLLSNKIMPTSDWATKAAETLNKQFNTTIYKAERPDKLVWNNQYVHTAFNGDGLVRGQYNDNAVGEFLWGAEDEAPAAV